MANQIIFGGNITPANAPMEVSYDGGATWTALAFPTVGAAQQGILNSVPNGSYAPGKVIERAIGYPLSAQANSVSLTIATPVYVSPIYTGLTVSAGSYGLYNRAESYKTGGWHSYNNSNGIQPPAGTTGGGMINADPNSGAGLDIAAAFEIHFQGTGFQLFGLSNSPYGEATATLDGVVQAAPISYHGGSGSVISVYAVSGLVAGNHIFRHQCTGYGGSSCIPQFYTVT